jgi:hypothetical protein
MNLKDFDKRFKEFVKSGFKKITDYANTDIYDKTRFYTLQETADILRISKKTISNQRSKGIFPIKAKRHGRKTVLFEIRDVERYLKSLSEVPKL